MMNPAKKARYNNVCNLLEALQALQSQNFEDALGDDVENVLENLIELANNSKSEMENNYR